MWACFCGLRGEAARVAPAPHTSRVAHLLNVRPGSRSILVALTTAKVLGALVTSAAAAVSLSIQFPRLLRLNVRESFLRTKARQVDRDLATVKRR
jgi:ethylene receptor